MAVPLARNSCAGWSAWLFAAVLCLGTVVPAAAQAEWRRHVDGRLGLSVDVPARGFVRADPEAGNDGLRLVSADGSGEIAVYSVPLPSMSFAAFRRQLTDGARARGTRITYIAGGKSWFVFSGHWDGQIVYYKVLLKQVCGVPMAHQFHLRYPRDQKRAYDAVIERMDDTLRGVAGTTCG
ncbi:hypothetical protein [Rhodoligotrophos defluvii]|uniref:hypothetical protein n=1 Tax=Rhodoligotrophos defluvii TaxID=2561934 RepID=UPI0010C9A64A|nr:hypothetical protein [Rhodoligotrophos defluvii]